MLGMGLFLAAVLVPIQILFGHFNGNYVHERQLAKFAAIVRGPGMMSSRPERF